VRRIKEEHTIVCHQQQASVPIAGPLASPRQAPILPLKVPAPQTCDKLGTENIPTPQNSVAGNAQH